MIGDYLEDLKDYSPQQVSDACSAYRRDGRNKFFPTSGQLLDVLRERNSTPGHCRLPTFQAPRALEAPRGVKSVTEVLAAHGFERAAANWGAE